MDFYCRSWLSPLILACLLCLNGCASQKTVSDPSNIGVSVEEEKNIDPWETYNRGVFKLNDTLDGWLLKPVAKGYRFIAPTFVEKGVNNFFSNLGEVTGAVNNLLQWKWRKVGINSGRFLINTTVGVGGLFDIAKHTGISRQDTESFGQTLSHWGIGSGPYFVLPLLGPSTLTDALSSPVDWYTTPVAHADLKAGAYYGVKALDTVSVRANLLDAEELISGDRYIFIRDAFLQRREHLVKDGDVEDDFGGGDEDFDEDF